MGYINHFRTGHMVRSSWPTYNRFHRIAFWLCGCIWLQFGFIWFNSFVLFFIHLIYSLFGVCTGASMGTCRAPDIPLCHCPLYFDEAGEFSLILELGWLPASCSHLLSRAWAHRHVAMHGILHGYWGLNSGLMLARQTLLPTEPSL